MNTHLLLCLICYFHIITIIIFASHESSIAINLVHSSLPKPPISQLFYFPRIGHLSGTPTYISVTSTQFHEQTKDILTQQPSLTALVNTVSPLELPSP